MFDLPSLFDPLQQPYMQRALLAVVLVSIVCAVVGVFVVLRGLAFVGEAMRHALFAGVVIAFLLGGSLVGGGLIMALVIAWLIGVLGRQHDIGEDTAIGVLFSASFAIGIVLLGRANSGVRDLATILLGNVLGISNTDLWLTAVVAVVVLAVVIVFWKELVLAAFDPALALAQGRSLVVWDAILLVLLALSLTAAFQTVGNLLALALLLAPAATARLLTRRLPTMVLLSIVFAVLAGVIGLLLSFFLNVPSGPAIVLISGTGFGLALLFAPHTGAISNLRQRWRLRQGERSV